MTVLGLCSCCIVVLLHLPIAFSSTDWTNHGANIFNHRSASSEISARNLGKLALKWKFHTGADVSATASIANGVVYFPSFNGNLYAVNAETGSAVWEKNLTQLLGEPAVARATPVVAGALLLVDVLFPPIVVALNRSNAAKIWATPHLDPNPVAILTMSGTVHEGFYYVGVSSAEEMLSTNCCSFQGSLQKLKVSTGEIVWRTSMLPDNGGRPGGYAGAAIWGSSPSIDADRRLVFIATGNNYQVPASVVECENHRGNETAGVLEPNPCEDAGNNAESIVALSLDSGRVVWSKHLGGYDVYSTICVNKTEKPPECPESLGPDFDFGEAPMIIHLKKRGRRTERCIVVAGQKSGFVWALDCDSGDVVWWKVDSSNPCFLLAHWFRGR